MRSGNETDNIEVVLAATSGICRGYHSIGKTGKPWLTINTILARFLHDLDNKYKSCNILARSTSNQSKFFVKKFTEKDQHGTGEF